MRYVESRARSAEILRLALQFMGREPAAFNPCTFALWYEHCAGINPALSDTLEAHLRGHSPLTDEDVWHLYTQHILARHVRENEGVRQELYRILRDTAADTQVAGETASAFDEALAHHSEHLATAKAAEAVRDTLEDLRDDTGKMRAMTAELAARLKASTEEVSALTQNLQRAENQALLDALTGLRNRRGFELAANELQIQHGGMGGIAIMMIDIDHFKAVNDEHGHVLGDRVLRAVAHVLNTNIKGRDVAARYGGEEFAVLLPDTSLSGAEILAKQIRALVASGRIKRSNGRGTIGQVTISIGVAVARQSETLEQLLERADAALYSAKRSGRNRVEVA